MSDQTPNSKFHILVVDDEEWGRDPMVDIMESEGYKTTGAESGEEAIRIVQTVKFDLIIMDVSMPKIDGLEATRRIRQINGYQSVPIFMLSGLAQPEDMQAGLQAGANAYLTKPIDPVQFLKKIAAILNQGDSK